MQSFIVTLAAALCSVALAQMNLPAPSIFIVVQGSSLSAPQKVVLNATMTYTVKVGANVTIGCQYTDGQFQTTIGKWSTSGPTGSADKLFPLYTNGFATDAFADLIVRYPDVDARIDGTASMTPPSPIISYVMLINVKQYDLGKYGCYSNFGTSKSTLYANVTLQTDNSDLYGVRSVSSDQQVVVTPTSSVTSYSCYVFRGPSSTADYLMWFDKCQWSNLGQDVATARTISCSNTPSTWNSVTNLQVVNSIGTITSAGKSDLISSDMYPFPAGSAYNGFVFWAKNLVRDTYNLGLSPTTIYAADPNSWLNRTLGCFAYRNASSTINFLSDYITFVRPGVDLDLDPTQFSCGRHHYVAQQGTVVPIYCIVAQPSYRTVGTIGWEVWTPSTTQQGSFNTVSVTSQQDVNNQKWGKFVVWVGPIPLQEATVGDAAQKRQGTGLNVTVDSATTLTFRYRLIVTYTDSSTARSEFFSIATSAAGSGIIGSGPQGTPQKGAMTGAATSAVGSWSLALAVASIVAMLRLRI